MKIGIIGCGWIARKFVEAVNKVGGITLAVSARDINKAKAFAEEFCIQEFYGSYAELIEKGNLDGVYIAVTHNFHYDLVKMCLNVKIPVLCEKPLVLTEKEATDLFELAKENDTLLLEAMWTKMHQGFLQAKEWIKEGKIGKVGLINTTFGNYVPFDPSNRFYNKELAGGAMYDLGVYNIQFTCGILDEYPSEVTGTAIVGTTGVDESSIINMKFESGAIAMGSCTFHVATDFTGMVYGSDGYLTLSPFFAPEQVVRYDRNRQEIERYSLDEKNGFVYQVRHFVGLINTGKKESPLVPAIDTIDCARVFDTLNKQWGIN